MKKAFILALLIGGSLLTSVYAAPSFEIKTDAGIVRGVEQEGVLSWLGIPYAQPPMGNLRWAPPARPKPWSTPLEATKYGSTCAQNKDLGAFANAGGSEDCLTLNVFVSKEQTELKSTKGLPVFVWIHGGAMRVGAALDHNPSKLAKDGGVIVVSMNYRLGLFGYFGHPAFRSNGQSGVNYGIMDQQLALDWVQHNIKAFGGDPDNVTIAGESSGGDSVMSHIVAPESAGKFQHVIAMSGNANILKNPTFGAPKPLEWAEQTATAFASEMKCTKGDIAKCLRSLSTQEVLAHQSPYTAQQVIVDGKVIPMPLGDALRTGHINSFSTFTNGITRDEGTFFAGYLENESGQPMDEAGYTKMAEIFFGSHAVDVLKQYPSSDYLTPSDAFSAAATDMLFACTAHKVNGWMSTKVPTYAYEFADRTAPSYLKPTTFALGAGHTYELSYIFPRFHGGSGIPVTLNKLQEKLSDEMVAYWTDAGERRKEWSRYNIKEDNVMSFVLPQSNMTKNQFSQVHQCDFWDSLEIY